ncbi:MAG: hypothetical protein GF317_09120 [Candidatus Lokiarchaeota archaeon]|nr:hypothetical protein [Candidatus Lokiarchaeota archaeon]
MKQKLQIIGAEMVGATKVKVMCIPYTTDKIKAKRPSMFDIARGGAGIQDLIQKTEEQKSRFTIFYIERDTWINEFGNALYSVIDVDITPTLIFGKDTNKKGDVIGK